MIIDNLTNLLDSPVTTVFLVVAFGGLFMRIVWLPYRATTVNLNKNNRYKKEVFLRLTELQLSFENQYSCKIIDRAGDTSKGTAYRQDTLSVFFKSFFNWNSVNYIPKQILFFYFHGIKVLLPFYFVKFLLGTSYAYFFKYKKLKI